MSRPCLEVTSTVGYWATVLLAIPMLCTAKINQSLEKEAVLKKKQEKNLKIPVYTIESLNISLLPTFSACRAITNRWGKSNRCIGFTV